MPGIFGLASPRPAQDCERLVARMRAAMLVDPDHVSGSVDMPGLGIRAGWVARRDSMAHRVSSASARDVAVGLAGECFLSADELPAPPLERAARIRDQIGRLGFDAVLPRLTGQFSAVVADHQRGRLYLANDRFGMERIYVHECGDEYYFASEAKALLAVLPATRSWDERGVADFACFGSVLAGRTLFRGIEQLPQGSIVEFTVPRLRRRRHYFVPADWSQAPPDTADAFEERLAGSFRAVVQPYLATPPRIGISITGGLDTRMLVAAGLSSGADAVCYTFDAPTGRTLDSRIGAEIAVMCGLKHHIIRLAPDFLASFHEYLDRTVLATDGCAGVLAAHEVPFNRDARALAPVRITGNFGSEILRSMSTLKPLGLQASLLSAELGRAVDDARRAATEESIHPVTRTAFREIPWHLFGTLCAARSQLTVRAPFLDNEIVRLAYRAPASMRATAAVSLRLIERFAPDLARVSTDRGIALGRPGPAALLRRLYRNVSFKLDYLHKEGLPSGRSGAEGLLTILDRAGVLGDHKYLPYRRWFRFELAPYAREAVAAIASRGVPWWDRPALIELADEHATGRANRLRELHVVLTLDAVERTLLRAPAPVTAAATVLS